MLKFNAKSIVCALPHRCHKGELTYRMPVTPIMDDVIHATDIRMAFFTWLDARHAADAVTEALLPRTPAILVGYALAQARPTLYKRIESESVTTTLATV